MHYSLFFSALGKSGGKPNSSLPAWTVAPHVHNFYPYLACVDSCLRFHNSKIQYEPKHLGVMLPLGRIGETPIRTLLLWFLG